MGPSEDTRDWQYALPAPHQDTPVMVVMKLPDNTNLITFEYLYLNQTIQYILGLTNEERSDT